MSKLYDKYRMLKDEDETKMYLFRVGKFYIFLADDCDKINEYMVLKKTKFSNDTYKCGFPINVLDEYLSVFKNHNLNVQVIEDYSLYKGSVDDICDFIMGINIEKITPIDAILKLKEIQDLIKDGKRS